MAKFDHTTYLSPFSWRYGSEEMRRLFSEENKRKIWRKIWVALAKAQAKKGLVSQEELQNLIDHQDNINIDKAHEIEKDLQHDLMAEIHTFASQATIGGGKIHLGATSMDIEDNAEAIRQREALLIIEKKLNTLLNAFAKKIEQYKHLPCMAYTHLQPAEPTTLGYRFSFYAQDILFDLKLLNFVLEMLKGKGMKGAVGTAASYTALLDKKGASEIEQDVMKELGIEAVDIATQTSPRKIELFLSNFLSSIAQSLYKFAFDVRIMQSPGFGEWQEPFAAKQVGSSAMPFKRNPWKSEQTCSLGRLVKNYSQNAWDNAAHMLLERTLDDSPNRRSFIPEMFLAVDQMLENVTNILNGLVVNEKQIAKNLSIHGPFAATEVILMEAVKKNANRQEIHETIRENSMKAYETIQETGENHLAELLMNDERITQFIDKNNIPALLNPTFHIGLAEEKCTELLKLINERSS